MKSVVYPVNAVARLLAVDFSRTIKFERHFSLEVGNYMFLTDTRATRRNNALCKFQGFVCVTPS